MSDLNDQKIIHSWKKNATPWTTAVRENQIESRILVTNEAIVNTVLSYKPKTVLDIGCGEGWLARELCGRGIKVLGVDIVPDLIEKARLSCPAEFQVMSYEQIAEDRINQKFDTIACNFSLLGKESVEGIFKAVPNLLNPKGHFVIQTIHPVFGCGTDAYEDGWRAGSWQGFSDDFKDPAPWYFRTLTSWFNLFYQNGLNLIEIKEPLYSKTGEAASIIMISRLKKS